jgi:hypothetical protein
VAEKRLGAQVGFTAVLHTWSQTLNEHAHIHAIVPGGGLSPDGKKWIQARQNYLLPCKVLGLVFRAKYLDHLEQAYGRLSFPDDIAYLASPSQFKGLLVAAAKKDWVVYAKEPFAGPAQVLEYLGNYTHRIAISNYRIESIDPTHVTFRYKDRADGNKTKLMKLPGQEFIRRFLSHVLPDKFVRIRHFGFLGSRQKKKNIETARRLLQSAAITVVKEEDYKALLKRVVGVDIDACPKCAKGKLTIVQTIFAHPCLRPFRSDTS